MNIEIKMFGPFRALGDQLSLRLEAGSHASDISPAIEKYIKNNGGDQRLIDTLPVSRFATEKLVLSSSHKLENGMSLAILPPVAGG